KRGDTKEQGGRGSNRGTDIEIRLLISLSVPELSSIAPVPPLCLCFSVFFHHVRIQLHRQDFLFFLLGNFFEFADVVVRKFLDFSQSILFVVFRDGFILEHFL